MHVTDKVCDWFQNFNFFLMIKETSLCKIPNSHFYFNCKKQNFWKKFGYLTSFCHFLLFSLWEFFFHQKKKTSEEYFQINKINLYLFFNVCTNYHTALFYLLLSIMELEHVLISECLFLISECLCDDRGINCVLMFTDTR